MECFNSENFGERFFSFNPENTGEELTQCINP